MILYVVVPRVVGAGIDERTHLPMRAQEARELRREALEELATLKAGGYMVMKTFEHATDYSVNDVYVVQRGLDETELDLPMRVTVG